MTVVALGIGSLLQVILASLVAGVGVTVVFAVAIVGAVHAVESRRGGRNSAYGWGALAVVAMLGIGAAVAAGLWTIAA